MAIFGAGSGIGLATVKLLFPMGVQLSLTDDRKEALEAAVSQIASASSMVDAKKIFATVIDVRYSTQVNSWITQTVETFGALHRAANLAGVVHENIGISDIMQLTDEEWSFVTDINLTGVFYAVRAQLQAMEKFGCSGSIVNAASTAGIGSAAKHGVVGLTRSAAKEVRKKGNRVNAIASGVIDTPMVQTLPTALSGGVDWMVQHNQALGRRAQPLEIAKLIAFLLSEECSFTTGAVYVADGGQAC